MLKCFFILFFAITVLSASAQVTWYNDLRSAQAVALSKNQLIVMDFWAIWCGPCKAMDSQMWSLPEMERLSEKFVSLKIDVDQDRATAQQYQARSIPKVVIANAAGEVIYEQVGYGGPEPYLSLLQAMPENVSTLNEALLPLLNKKAVGEDYLHLGQEYQKLARQTSNDLLKYAFLDMSDQSLKKVVRKSENESLVEAANLHSILNEAYRNKPERAMKKLTRLEEESQHDEVLELKRFITAYCYKCIGNDAKLAEEKKQISNQAYLKQLDENE
ncbi:thioredoxin domain-containing protein [Catalinimonas sp. 4WD22]|uniref:thioredoxin family protein n=1 Tax=Catalinimonas locisalis TaxID=3133978 RepID=UPI003100B5C6